MPTSQEYLDIIKDSLEPLKHLIPGSAKLLFVCIVDELKLAQSYANSQVDIENEIDPDILSGIVNLNELLAGKEENFGLYNECFILCSLSPDNTNNYLPLKNALILPTPELKDLDPVERTQAVREWLMADDNSEEYFCDHLTEEILPDGWRVFIPNRVPLRYDDPNSDYEFISIF